MSGTPEFIITEEKMYNEQTPVYEITLNRPDKRNALHWQMMSEIDAALDDAERAFNDGTARVLVFRAEGRAFSSGIDLEWFMNSAGQYGERWIENLFPTTSDLQKVMTKIENHSLPSICAMHGYCLGMAFELAVACDFRIAADRTRMGLPETRLGIIPDVGGTTRLLKLVGPGRAKELILTGRNFEADLAEAWGIVNYVVPKDELMGKVEELAGELALSAPLAVSYAKRVINDILENQRGLQIEAWGQASLIRSEDFRNGVMAMLTKNYPVEWKGK